MIRKTVFVLLTLLSVSGLALARTLPASALFDNARDEACAGIQLKDEAKCDSTAGAQANGLLKTAVDVLSFVVGIAAVIAIIIGGLRYVTSAGDSNGVNGAKNTIMYAIIGLVIVALAQIIVKFVLNKGT